MNIRITFSKPTHFLGRNGTAACSGLHWVESPEGVHIAPLTSQGKVGRCEIVIPTEDVVSVACSLLAFNKTEPKEHVCTFVEMSDLVPKAWRGWFEAALSENAPFGWGDNNRTLVTARALADHCDDVLELHGENTSRSAATKFLKKLRALGETYIDLEN
jgi:hypothetical protein